MKPSREELAAFADGELDPARRAEIEAMMEKDTGLAAEVAAHHALKARLAAHFDPILSHPLPERLTAPLHRNEPQVIDFAAESAKRTARRHLPRWSYFAAPAVAAALALAVFVPGRQAAPGADYADPQLATVLDSQLSGPPAAGNPTRVLISFKDSSGEFCRAFNGQAQSGIACRDQNGWRLAHLGPGYATSNSEYRQAGSADAALMKAAQNMAAGPALDASAEQAARQSDWLPSSQAGKPQDRP